VSTTQDRDVGDSVARLGFSVAVHLAPEILLIDEILVVGDAHFQAKRHERLDGFRQQA